MEEEQKMEKDNGEVYENSTPEEKLLVAMDLIKHVVQSMDNDCDDPKCEKEHPEAV